MIIFPRIEYPCHNFTNLFFLVSLHYSHQSTWLGFLCLALILSGSSLLLESGSETPAPLTSLSWALCNLQIVLFGNMWRHHTFFFLHCTYLIWLEKLISRHPNTLLNYPFVAWESEWGKKFFFVPFNILKHSTQSILTEKASQYLIKWNLFKYFQEAAERLMNASW